LVNIVIDLLAKLIDPVQRDVVGRAGPSG
jgi:hypothetical protein